jgi:predicted phosphodiesterase
MAINKNISIWKGDENPPTKYHLWVKDNGDICAYLDGKWGKVASVDQADKIQLVTTGPTDEYEETY